MAGRFSTGRWLVAPLLALTLSGCISVPEAIRGTSPTPQQDLIRVMNAPQLYVGQEARFGGRVVDVKNLQGSTRLEIATVPLDASAAPVLGAASVGRIYADVNQFLDPVDFRNRLVTVVGPITGTEKGTIGKTPYNYLIVQVNGFKRWRVTQQVVMPPQPIDPWMWGPGPWRYGPWGGWYSPMPAQVQSVVTE
ncbi:Slp/YeaY family lipoprotein [Enterobacteriaceae bacterium BIT-l23]|uniref:Slp/YeaY family lipoprotein n=1 Tax=Jejubacter calystegiae TaxID=2579935 RepID=A0A4P8YP12_9ENTR|nr:Slp/YeaY family lipoprotein [Jejubacter calystegiae]NUU68363.1 Slp/YeaY family lipoprotein [Enterobacteriaceae bacterium BIT-l23]QCT21698.1 Slp/YeaY family lipoprotein [Jejubacter calystegiae]